MLAALHFLLIRVVPGHRLRQRSNWALELGHCLKKQERGLREKWWGATHSGAQLNSQLIGMNFVYLDPVHNTRELSLSLSLSLISSFPLSLLLLLILMNRAQITRTQSNFVVRFICKRRMAAVAAGVALVAVV